jgi:hypothetical protein
MSLIPKMYQAFSGLAHSNLIPYGPLQNSWPFTRIQEKFETVGSDPDFDNDFEKIVTEHGYVFENHPVTTDDGYILNVYRIKKDDLGGDKKKPAVFLQHGVTDTADCWIMQTVDKAPAFRMVDAGYDVWLGN